MRERILSLHVLGPPTTLNYMVQYQPARLDASFAALSDVTRRGVLQQLGRSDASITELADKFHMTLTGMKKHVGVLERAGLVTTEKVGRVRTCRLGVRRLEEEAAWIEKLPAALGRALRRAGRNCRRIETEGEEPMDQKRSEAAATSRPRDGEPADRARAHHHANLRRAGASRLCGVDKAGAARCAGGRRNRSASPSSPARSTSAPAGPTASCSGSGIGSADGVLRQVPRGDPADAARLDQRGKRGATP